MSVRKRSVNHKIIGRYPYSVTPQGVACYAEFNIEDDETLRDFLRTPDEYWEFIVIKLLEMYVKAEDIRNNEVAQNESRDDTPFLNEGDDEEEEDVELDLTREHALPPVRPRVCESHMPFHSRHIPYLDHLPSMPDVDALTRDIDKIRTTIWDESRPTELSNVMLFPDKARLIRAVKIYSVKECCEMMVWESSSNVYKVVCRRWFACCNWILRARKKKKNIWVVGKYIGTHNCEIDTFSGNHFNLDVDLIFLVLIPHIEDFIRYKIKECITSIHQEYGCTVTKRKAFFGRKRALEIVYGDWDKSFASLPRYMATLQHFNPQAVVQWKLERSPEILEHIFRYVF
ncbi:uncharacterized protein [Nicotiana sylvestris]|uniref:uncharacterized protein n=1 Tax=Nicotiana sylvestris TaxID=4096 RepID=UPI00388C8D70